MMVAARPKASQKEAAPIDESEVEVRDLTAKDEAAILAEFAALDDLMRSDDPSPAAAAEIQAEPIEQHTEEAQQASVDAEMAALEESVSIEIPTSELIEKDPEPVAPAAVIESSKAEGMTESETRETPLVSAVSSAPASYAAPPSQVSYNPYYSAPAASVSYPVMGAVHSVAHYQQSAPPQQAYHHPYYAPQTQVSEGPVSYPSMVPAVAPMVSEPAQPAAYPMIGSSSAAVTTVEERKESLESTQQMIGGESESVYPGLSSPLQVTDGVTGELFRFQLEKDVIKDESEPLCSPLGYPTTDRGSLKITGGGSGGGAGPLGPPAKPFDKSPETGKSLQEIADAIFKVYNKTFRKKKNVKMTIVNEFALGGLCFTQRVTVAELISTKKKKLTLSDIITKVTPNKDPLCPLLLGMSLPWAEYVALWLQRALHLKSKDGNHLICSLLCCMDSEELVAVRTAFDKQASSKGKKDLPTQIKSRFSSMFSKKRHIVEFFHNLLSYRKVSDLEPLNMVEVDMDVAKLVSMMGVESSEEDTTTSSDTAAIAASATADPSPLGSAASASTAADDPSSAVSIVPDEGGSDSKRKSGLLRKGTSFLSGGSSSSSSSTSAADGSSKKSKKPKSTEVDKSYLIELFSVRSGEHIAAVARKFQALSSSSSLLDKIEGSFKADSVQAMACLITLMYATRRYQFYKSWMERAMESAEKNDPSCEGLTLLLLLRSERDLANVIDLVGRDKLGMWLKIKYESKYPDYFRVVCHLCDLSP